ncbi:phosphoribosylamine--glycine ligase, partial [Myxococcota bacterium]|nr:phosphoribosylamine--glycine ligase [Myxococcota bacterium]
TQPLMVAMDDDIMPWLLGASRGRLPAGEPRFREGTALTVVLAAENYPGVPVKGMPISGLSRADTMENIKVFFAGTRVHGGTHVVNGGRVLGVTAFGRDLCEARRRAYEAVTEISFSGMQYRTDIGGKRGTNG